ncbi:hypothetical protein MNBD_PLANCTO03-171 [hydrothermal vent metagenome]|uniref:Uncharacterized protein n=1 Tax=hydrothermal vent metagenome TaxID=652676 RepID=A0A3B1DPH9_9ZZZZ
MVARLSEPCVKAFLHHTHGSESRATFSIFFSSLCESVSICGNNAFLLLCLSLSETLRPQR